MKNLNFVAQLKNMQYFCTRISIVFRVLEFSVSRLQRMRNRLLILLWSMGLFVPLTAFGVEIRGVVLDSLTEESLVGATIVIQGEPSNGTTTGLDGTFVLRTEVAHPVVCCSYMGYESVEVPYTGSRMTLRLREQTTAISEVTVVSNYNGSTGAKAIEIERVVFIDTTPLIGKYHKDSLDYPSVPQQDAKKQLAWLEEELSGAKEDWVVVVGHHPIYAHTTKSESERKDMQKRVDPILRRHNVDMYICGHIHNFQHIKAGYEHRLCGQLRRLACAQQSGSDRGNCFCKWGSRILYTEFHQRRTLLRPD